MWKVRTDGCEAGDFVKKEREGEREKEIKVC
jgi:hypothetical protein